jgi:hypothetical protein
LEEGLRHLGDHAEPGKDPERVYQTLLLFLDNQAILVTKRRRYLYVNVQKIVEHDGHKYELKDQGRRRQQRFLRVIVWHDDLSIVNESADIPQHKEHKHYQDILLLLVIVIYEHPYGKAHKHHQYSKVDYKEADTHVIY